MRKSLLALTTFAAAALASAARVDPETMPPVGAAVGTYTRAAAYDGVETRSFHLTMNDGVRIAATLILPEGLAPGTRLPTVFRQTRYFRDVALRFPFDLFVETPRRAVSHFFVLRGYAWVDIDVRGTGASFGVQDAPWSDREVQDAGAAVDWIVRQPWSDGRVGATGISYDGTAAEMLLVNGHPAVKAVAPLYSLFDTYLDIAFPGGVHLEWLTRAWGELNRALDANRLAEHMGFPTRLALRGVLPVDGDDGTLVAEAVAGRSDNWDPHECALLGSFRDDVVVDRVGRRLSLPSPHLHLDAFRKAGVPVYGMTGWYDGAYAHAAIKRFLNVRTPGSRVLIGPWNHGGTQNVSPFASDPTSRFDHAGELLRFFDEHVAGIPTGITSDLPFVYYTMGEERWKAADAWPPHHEPATLYLGDRGTLTTAPPSSGTAFDDYAVDLAATSGEVSRWRALLSPPERIGYFDREEQDERLLVYTSTPLAVATEVTGHVELRLHAESLGGAPHLITYLEDVAPDGRVTYVTEGALALKHRKLSDRAAPYADAVPYRSFERADELPVTPGPMELVLNLQPISYQFQAGHRVRLAFAGADAAHFDTPARPGMGLRLHRAPGRASRLVLPVVPPPSRSLAKGQKPRESAAAAPP